MRSTAEIVSNLATVAFFSLIFISCYQAPNFPNEPEISFNNIVFSKGTGELEPDSLILTVNFRDGDGDLGLSNQGIDTREPYNDLWYFIKEDGTLVELSDRGTPGFEDLPPYEFPYYCSNYVLEGEDTLYVEQNEYHHNINVKFFVKKNGQYTEFDFETAFDPICGESFNGRYPLLNDVNRDRPLEGKLKYKMESVGFEFLFRLDTIMLEVFIYDRALNKSNVIQTPDFVLRDITLGG